MKITYPGFVSAVAVLIAIIVIGSHLALLASGFEENTFEGFPYKVVEAGCQFQNLALPLLVVAFVLQAIVVYLAVRGFSKEQPAISLGKKLKYAFSGKSNPVGLTRNLMATSSLVLVVFFVIQLSYLVGHCE